MRKLLVLGGWGALVVVGLSFCFGVQGEESPATFRHLEELHAEGLHNLFRVSEGMYSGSQPEGEAGFASLKKLGIKTVITVDGAPPDVETARKYGLRYVHLPIGYDGIPRETMLRLAKAAQVLPGPIYVHCHHGKHRGPAAVAAIGLCNDQGCRAADAVSFMQRAQTDPKYKGLYAVPKEFRPPSMEEMKRVSIDFPEVAVVDDLTAMMAKIDHEFEMVLPLTMDRPPESREGATQGAVLLNEYFREVARLPEINKRSGEFREDLKKSIELSEKLYRLLQEDSAVELQRQAAKELKQSCTHCHVRDRDNP